MRGKTSLALGKGFNFDLPPSELAPGFWSSGSNFRFRGGIDEMWDGATLYYNSGSVVPLWGHPVDFGTNRAIYVSSTKAYSITGAASVTEITRYTDGQVVSNATAVGTTVTITTAAAHGLSTGNIITSFGFTPSTYNAGAASITVTGGTTFTYVVGSAPAISPATYMGGYMGNAISNHSSLTGFYRYTGGAFNGLFLFNHPIDGLYYTDGGPMQKVPGFNVSATWSKANVVRPFRNFIFALGRDITGATHRQRVSWSDIITDPIALPASWSSTSTNKAGETQLTQTDGALVDCLPLGDVNIIYANDGRYAAQYTEATEVFIFTKLPGGAGLAYPNCVVDTPVGHVFLTPDFDVMTHNGGEPKSIAVNRFKKYIQDNINNTYAHLSFLAHDPGKGEVLICFPTTATTVCDKAVVWNYVDDTVGFLDLTSGATSASGVSFAVNGQWPNAASALTFIDSIGFFCYHATDSAKTGIYLTAEGPTGQFFGTDVTGTLIREGMDLGDRDLMKTLQRSRWNIDGTAGDTVSIYHGSSKFADTAATYTSAVTYTIGTTDYANARATQGRFLAVKLITATVSTTLRLRSSDLDVAPGGKR